jgi:hypothetical protein
MIIVVVYGLIAWWWWANPTAMVEPDKVRLANGQGEKGHHLTKVQSHYQQVIEMNSKRKQRQC